MDKTSNNFRTIFSTMKNKNLIRLKISVKAMKLEIKRVEQPEVNSQARQDLIKILRLSPYNFHSKWATELLDFKVTNLNSLTLW